MKHMTYLEECLPPEMIATLTEVLVENQISFQELQDIMMYQYYHKHKGDYESLTEARNSIAEKFRKGYNHKQMDGRSLGNVFKRLQIEKTYQNA